MISSQHEQLIRLYRSIFIQTPSMAIQQSSSMALSLLYFDHHHHTVFLNNKDSFLPFLFISFLPYFNDSTKETLYYEVWSIYGLVFTSQWDSCILFVLQRISYRLLIVLLTNHFLYRLLLFWMYFLIILLMHRMIQSSKQPAVLFFLKNQRSNLYLYLLCSFEYSVDTHKELLPNHITTGWSSFFPSNLLCQSDYLLTRMLPSFSWNRTDYSSFSFYSKSRIPSTFVSIL